MARPVSSSWKAWCAIRDISDAVLQQHEHLPADERGDHAAGGERRDRVEAALRDLVEYDGHGDDRRDVGQQERDARDGAHPAQVPVVGGVLVPDGCEGQR